MKNIRWVLAMGLIAALFALSPFLWMVKKTWPYDVFVLDKTVPDHTYREHAGLFWILNHEKITHSDGSRYDETADYYGYHPAERKGDETIPPLHHKPDMVYITDTYGVYKQDLAPEGNEQGERSGLVYGGMKAEEWRAVEQMRKEGAVVLAEFNTFASPTPLAVRKQMEHEFGITWTGWIGRYFLELESEEVPVWVRSNYEKQTGNKYAFHGPGLVFTSEVDEVVVLDQTMFSDQVWFRLTADGKGFFSDVKEAPYQYWFDIVQPADRTEVLAQYGVQVNAKGRAALDDYRIPESFPAVVRRSDAHTYYFAGDYADIKTKAWAHWRGAARFLAFTSAWNGRNEFYWRVYVPMMQEILQKEKGS